MPPEVPGSGVKRPGPLAPVLVGPDSISALVEFGNVPVVEVPGDPMLELPG
jgi:hypothetical protein